MKAMSFIFTVLMLLVATGAYAQLPQGNATPIDGGASLLLAGAAAYGYKCYRDGRKRK